MTPAIAFALGFEDGAKRVLGDDPSKREAIEYRPSLAHGWGPAAGDWTDLYDLYLNGYGDGVKGDRFRLDGAR